MIVQKYEIEVCEGIMNHIHGGGHTITEYYIPSLNLFVNDKAVFVQDDEDFVTGRLQHIKNPTSFVLTDEFKEHILISLANEIIGHGVREKMARKILYEFGSENSPAKT